MKTIRRVALSAIALTALLSGAAVAADLPPTATLTVTGEGTATPAPDRAMVSFQVQTTDPASAKATSENAAIANAIGAQMMKLGLPPAAVTTAGYGLNYVPRPSRPDPASDQRYGYTVSRTIDVTVDGVDRAGAIVDAGVAGGATNVNGVSFMLRDPQAAQRAAQTAAMARARRRGRRAPGADPGDRAERRRRCPPRADGPHGARRGAHADHARSGHAHRASRGDRALRDRAGTVTPGRETRPPRTG
jgi:uncharacterized protein YggE